MAPISSADNGGFAFMLTFRPRPENFTERLVCDVVSFIEDKLETDWHLIVKEKGNHLHAAVFLHKPAQRQNIISKFIGDPRVKTSFAPLRNWDDNEKKNFSRYDRERKTGAVINMTTLGVVASYLSGEFDSKIGDDFEVLSQKLPPADDISELEEYLPAVDGLKRKRQISVWYAGMETYYTEAKKEKPIEGVTDVPLCETSLLMLCQHRMYVARDMDVIADERILQQKVRALLAYMKKEATGSYEDPRRLTHQDEGFCLGAGESMFDFRKMEPDKRKRVRLDLCLNCGNKSGVCNC